MNGQMNSETIIRSVRAWIDDFVVGERLCPFAGTPLHEGTVRFAVTGADSEGDLLDALTVELERLLENDGIETTLLIHPNVLGEFVAYNQFLDEVDDLLRRKKLEGIFQVASFHPQYQFAGTAPGDAENYSNRSPYPLLHLLREASIEAAIDGFSGIDEVPVRNIRHLERIGAKTLAERLAACGSRAVSDNMEPK